MNYTKTPFALTRGYLKSNKVKIESKEELTENIKVKRRKPYKKRTIKTERKFKRNRNIIKKEGPHTDRKYVCSICKKKHYKYRRNKLRHEKYECISGPQFSCDKCDKKYSQKKTLTMHLVQKHEMSSEIQANQTTKLSTWSILNIYCLYFCLLFFFLLIIFIFFL